MIKLFNNENDINIIRFNKIYGDTNIDENIKK